MEKKKLTLREIGPKRLVIIMLCGVALLILTFLGEGDNKDIMSVYEPATTPKSENIGGEESASMEEYIDDMERKVEEQLSKVEGVGDVEVMITLKASSEKIILKDENESVEIIDETDSSGGSRDNESSTRSEESVLIDGENGSKPYTVKETAPYIQGVVVVASGGDEARIKQEIIDAIQVLFDIEVHKIKVMKMVSD